MSCSAQKGTLQELVTAKRRKSFTDFEKGSDEEALGVLAAEFCNWSSPAIFKVISAILEDSNFHELNSQWQELIDERDGGN